MKKSTYQEWSEYFDEGLEQYKKHKEQTEVVLTTISNRLNITLNQLILYYSVSDEFKEGVDELLRSVNTRRVENGSKKIDMDFYLNSLVD